MIERASGFYWVRGWGEWLPAYWDGTSWGVTCDDRPCCDGDFDEIGEPCRHEDAKEVARLRGIVRQLRYQLKPNPDTGGPYMALSERESKKYDAETERLCMGVGD